MRDLHGLPLTTDAAAAEAFNRTLRSYLAYRTDTPQLMKATLAADPAFALGHCLMGSLMMLAFNRGSVAAAAQAQRNAAKTAAQATAREQMHVRALERWVAADVDGALRLWEDILRDHPRDVLALRLSHFNYFWHGRAQEMLACVERLRPHWSDDLPGWTTLLSCAAFALEECGDYAAAERAGRQAVALASDDVWGTHAVAHVMEMQGRADEGIAWLGGLEQHWDGKNHFVHHLWWHRALFHLQKREADTVLELYDRRFRDPASPLCAAIPDLYIDVQNAASMLFRLERHGVRVGDRWTELADHAEKRIGDCLSTFTLPHWAMALAAAGRDAAAARFVEGMRDYAAGGASNAPTVREVAIPVCLAVIAHRKGEHAAAVDHMRPVLPRLQELGGSHAQRHVLQQLFLDAERLRAGNTLQRG